MSLKQLCCCAIWISRPNACLKPPLLRFSLKRNRVVNPQPQILQQQIVWNSLLDQYDELMDCDQQISHDMELINVTQDAWRRVHEDCREAKQSIDFEQYILRDDENGTSFLRLLMEKAKEGLRVRVLLDRVGCRKLYQSTLVNDLRQAGAKVYFYNPVSWLNLPFPKTWFPRSHIKMSVVDSQVLHLGGVCFADYMSQWRDLHMRITGPIAQTVPFGWEQFRWNEKPAPNGDIRYVVSNSRKNPVYSELIRAINAASREIILATPYFFASKKA